MLGCPDLPSFANLEGLQHVQDAALRCAETAGTHDDSLSSAVKGPDCNRCDAARCGYVESYSEGRRAALGAYHPLTRVQEAVFLAFGFAIS